MAKRKTTRGGLPPHKYLDQLQVRQLLNYVRRQASLARKRGSRRAVINEMIVELLLFSGLRARELCSLSIRDTSVSHRKNLIYVRDGKGNVSRSVEIPKALTVKLEKFIHKYRPGGKPKSVVIPSEAGYRLLVEKSYLLRKNRKDGEPRFIIKENKRYTAGLSYRSLYSKVVNIGRKARIGRSTPHSLRHTYLTALYGVQSDIRFCQDQAGHRSISTTQIYTRTADESRRRQVEALEF